LAKEKEMRTNLKVPFSSKDRAKRLGAKWDSLAKCWYVENVTNIGAFMEWMPDHLRKPVEVKNKKATYANK